MTGSSGAAIEVTALHKRYGDIEAVDGLDLEIRPGEVFAILGPNGAGKTTTVEILEGYRHRDSGSVQVLGQDPRGAGRSWRARIGIVLQLTTTDWPEITVREAIHQFALFYPNPRDPEEVLSLVGLQGRGRSRIRQLSGGMSRRMDVALGIVGAPELLFLDEPTTGFDPEARRAFWSMIRDLHGDGTTIVLTTHYLDEAEALADRVAVIAGGRIRATGTPATLGGRDTAEATVTWIEDGQTRTIRTTRPMKTLTELASRLGGDVPGLTVTRPTLEDIYLELIGSQR